MGDGYGEDSNTEGGYNGDPSLTVCRDDCPVGHYITANQTACVVCESGTYNDEPNAGSCRADCAKGYFVTEDRASCTVCESGKYADQTGQQDTCIDDCGPGHFVTEDHTACVACQAGRYTALTGSQSSCLLCEVGRTSEGAATTCIRDDAAPEDAFGPDSGAAGGSNSKSNGGDPNAAAADSDPNAVSGDSDVAGGSSRTSSDHPDDEEGVGGGMTAFFIIVIVALAITVVALLVHRRRKSTPGAPPLFRPQSLFNSAPIARRDSNVSVGIIMDETDVDQTSLPVAELSMPVGAVFIPSEQDNKKNSVRARSSFPEAMPRGVAVAEGSGGGDGIAVEMLNPAHGASAAAAAAAAAVAASPASKQPGRPPRRGIQLKKRTPKNQPTSDKNKSMSAAGNNRGARLARLRQSMHEKQRLPKRKSQPNQQLR